MCECYGRYVIGADPDCPAHGILAHQEREQNDDLIQELRDRIRELEQENALLLEEVRQRN